MCLAVGSQVQPESPQQNAEDYGDGSSMLKGMVVPITVGRLIENKVVRVDDMFKGYS
jgi:hypothetical protein